MSKKLPWLMLGMTVLVAVWIFWPGSTRNFEDEVVLTASPTPALPVMERTVEFFKKYLSTQ